MVGRMGRCGADWLPEAFSMQEIPRGKKLAAGGSSGLNTIDTCRNVNGAVVGVTAIEGYALAVTAASACLRPSRMVP